MVAKLDCAGGVAVEQQPREQVRKPRTPRRQARIQPLRPPASVTTSAIFSACTLPPPLPPASPATPSLALANGRAGPLAPRCGRGAL